jgi:hypothetical protein
VLQVQTGRFGRHGDLGIGANACASETVATDRVPSEETTSAGADSANWNDRTMFGGQTECHCETESFRGSSLWARPAEKMVSVSRSRRSGDLPSDSARELWYSYKLV